MIDEIKKLTKEDFRRLSNAGILGPCLNDFIGIGQVIERKKPIAWVDEDSGIWAKMYSYKHGLNLTVNPVVMPTNSMITWNPTCVVYRDYLIYNEFCKIYAMNVSNTPRLIFHSILMGDVLGYCMHDVVKFLDLNFGYSKVKNTLKHWTLTTTGDKYAVKFSPLAA